MKKSITSSSLGLVDRHSTTTIALAGLVGSLLALAIGTMIVLLPKDQEGLFWSPSIYFVTSAAMAIVTGLVVHYRFVILDRRFARQCGRSQFEYLPTDIFECQERHLTLSGTLTDDFGFYCTYTCKVYRVDGYQEREDESLPAQMTHSVYEDSVRVMFCFPDESSMQAFMEMFKRGVHCHRDDYTGFTRSLAPVSQFPSAVTA